MNENVFARLSLNESVPFGGIKPLHCTLFFAQLRYSSAYGIASYRKGRCLARYFCDCKRGRMLPQNFRRVQWGVANIEIATAISQPGWNSSKTAQSRVLVGMHVEDRIEPGDLEQVVNFFGQVQ
jgi:hypothetical protein